jgi:hypothetical protein
MQQISFWVLLVIVSSTSNGQGKEVEKHSSTAIAHGNKALKAWIEYAERDDRFLLYDQEAKILSLRHGKAILRRCLVVSDTISDIFWVKTFFLHHLRRFRPLKFSVNFDLGPYDWEERLVRSAPPDGAMYFENGLILSHSPYWAKSGASTVLLSLVDFRALFDSYVVGMPLIILPVNWRSRG